MNKRLKSNGTKFGTNKVYVIINNSKVQFGDLYDHEPVGHIGRHISIDTINSNEIMHIYSSPIQMDEVDLSYNIDSVYSFFNHEYENAIQDYVQKILNKLDDPLRG